MTSIEQFQVNRATFLRLFLTGGLSIELLAACGQTTTDQPFSFTGESEGNKFNGGTSSLSRLDTGFCHFFPDPSVFATQDIAILTTQQPLLFIIKAQHRTIEVLSDVTFSCGVGLAAEGKLRTNKALAISIPDLTVPHHLYFSWENWNINNITLDGLVPDSRPSNIIK